MNRGVIGRQGTDSRWETKAREERVNAQMKG